MKNMWDEKYSASHYVYGTEANDFLRENFAEIPKGKVLCLAEGEGRNAVFLAQQGYQVTAVDASLVGLQKAKQLAKEKHIAIEFIHQDLANYSIEEGKWDGIVSIFCHVPAAIRIKLHKQIGKGLKPNGVLLLEAYRPAQLNYKTGGPPTVEDMMSADSLMMETSGLVFKHLKELEREIHEGTNHFGKGAVVQVLGVK